MNFLKSLGKLAVLFVLYIMLLVFVIVGVLFVIVRIPFSVCVENCTAGAHFTRDIMDKIGGGKQ